MIQHEQHKLYFIILVIISHPHISAIRQYKKTIEISHLSEVSVGSSQEVPHHLAGFLKRAIDSSKQNQIKTSHLQTLKKKKKTPTQSNVKRLAT